MTNSKLPGDCGPCWSAWLSCCEIKGTGAPSLRSSVRGCAPQLSRMGHPHRCIRSLCQAAFIFSPAYGIIKRMTVSSWAREHAILLLLKACFPQALIFAVPLSTLLCLLLLSAGVTNKFLSFYLLCHCQGSCTQHFKLSTVGRGSLCHQ